MVEKINFENLIFERKNKTVISNLDSDSNMILLNYRTKHDGKHIGNVLLQSDSYDRLQSRMIKKKLQNLHIVSSFILLPNERNLKSHHKKKALNAEIENMNVMDLGDSRNFQDAKEIIEKIKLIEDCMCYIGSLCSWADIARLYNKPVITISEKEEV